MSSTEAEVPASRTPQPSRRAFVLIAAVALAAAVACGIGATAAASTSYGRHSFGAAARTAVGSAAESLKDGGKPDRPQRGLGLPGSSSVVSSGMDRQRSGNTGR
jgi:hypothetical protein